MKKRLAKKVVKNPERYHPHQIAAANRRLKISKEPDADDSVSCKGCGNPITDAEHDDNHGLCNKCEGEP